MKCPSCHSENNKVTDSRIKHERRYRKRLCNNCGQRFATTELLGTIRENMPLLRPKVEKRNGELEDFDRDKLLQSITITVNKSKRAALPVEKIVDEIEQDVALAPDTPFSTEAIAVQVLKMLKKYDQLGYVRYLSVHQQMEGPEDIRTLIQELQQLLSPPPVDESDDE